MPEHLIARAHLVEVLTALYREKHEQLVYAAPDGDENLRVITTVVDEVETR